MRAECPDKRAATPRRPFRLTRAYDVSISAGVAVGREGDSFEQVYLEADRALYAAKRAGRNCVCISPALGSLDKPYFDRKSDLNPDPGRWSA
jgi:hypothetical protein